MVRFRRNGERYRLGACNGTAEATSLEVGTAALPELEVLAFIRHDVIRAVFHVAQDPGISWIPLRIPSTL